MSRVIHFDLSADDPERAVNFYKNVFGWKIEKWDGPTNYWMIQTGDESDPGITGGIAQRIKPNDTTVVIYDVESVDEFSQKVLDSGGTIREQKKNIPGVGFLVICRDTDGNTFGIMEIEQSVK
jgi:predicted enzyme related to lactoylglutathione lyase